MLRRTIVPVLTTILCLLGTGSAHADADYTFTTLAGSVGNPGFTNGQGTAARFSSLQGIAIDSSGNLYVAESHNRAIRKITTSGLVTTFYDGSNGSFGAPRGVGVDAGGNVYVTDYSANVIRKVTATGVLSLVAGTAPTPGSTDGASTAALFYAPSAVAVDSANNLYVADTSNNTLRKIISGGTVSTLAGLAGRSSSVNGTGSAARFEDPYAIAVDGSGNAYVADGTDHSIRKINGAGVVTTLAGNPGTFGSADGSGSAALFKTPLGIAADSSGTVYVADTGNSTIRKITPAGVVTTLAGTANYLPSVTSQALSTYATSRGYEVLASVAGGEGFWVNAKTAYTVSLPNSSAISAATLQSGLRTGWNLVAVGETKNPADFSATSLWAWDATQLKWYFYAASLNASGELATHIQNGGYLDFAATSKQLGPGVGFWVNKP